MTPGAGDGVAPRGRGATARAAAAVVLRALAARPWLWPTAARTVLRLAAPGWWRHWPPLPVPPDGYWHFRMVTAFGGEGEDAVPTADDVVSYLRWCRSMTQRAS